MDPRYFGKANIENRIQSFLQMLDARKQRGPGAPLPPLPMSGLPRRVALPVLKDGGEL